MSENNFTFSEGAWKLFLDYFRFEACHNDWTDEQIEMSCNNDDIIDFLKWFLREKTEEPTTVVLSLENEERENIDMNEERKKNLFQNLFDQIIEISAGPEEAHRALRRCGMTDQEILECSEGRVSRVASVKADFYGSLECYAAGYMKAVPEAEYKMYRHYLDVLKNEVFVEPGKAAEYIIEAEQKARIRDYRRRMTEDVTADIYSAAVEHLKNALFDSKPYKAV